MPRQTKIVNMSLPPEIYKEVDELAQQKGISRSELLRQALRQYVASERRWQQIRKWGEGSAKRLGIKDEKDVERIIDECEDEYQREIFSK
jgi:metal-responsive CopG/Arc/MetJ family transcriptional regulator